MSESNQLVQERQVIDEEIRSPAMPLSHPNVPNMPRQNLGINRGLSFSRYLYSWQPMGIRIGIQLPFVGNDRDPLFVIRHSPFIPHPGHPFFQPYNIWQRWFPVLVPVNNFTDESITITQHSPPPMIAALAFSHRRWRGGISYRLNAVSNFTASGYIWVSKVRNVPRGIWQPTGGPNMGISRINSSSTFNGMPSSIFTNSYLRSDVSMFRHIEVTSPYEYISPYQDLEQALAETFNGTRPSAPGILFTHSTNTSFNFDDYLVVGLRGAIAAENNANTLYYELEMKCEEDFEFSEPLLPFAGYETSPWEFKNANTVPYLNLLNTFNPRSYNWTTQVGDSTNIIWPVVT